MTYIVIFFVTRKPSLTIEEFKDYWENTHIPLLKSLTGPLFPLHHKRRYLARTERKGFGGPANRDHPPLIIRGTPDDFDFDGIAEMEWENEKTFQEYYRAIYETDVAAKLARDEEKFLDTGKMKAVVVGESTNTSR